MTSAPRGRRLEGSFGHDNEFAPTKTVAFLLEEGHAFQVSVGGPKCALDPLTRGGSVRLRLPVSELPSRSELIAE
jgi:hypothetical protein